MLASILPLLGKIWQIREMFGFAIGVFEKIWIWLEDEAEKRRRKRRRKIAIWSGLACLTIGAIGMAYWIFGLPEIGNLVYGLPDFIVEKFP